MHKFVVGSGSLVAPENQLQNKIISFYVTEADWGEQEGFSLWVRLADPCFQAT